MITDGAPGPGSGRFYHCLARSVPRQSTRNFYLVPARSVLQKCPHLLGLEIGGVAGFRPRIGHARGAEALGMAKPAAGQGSGGHRAARSR